MNENKKGMKLLTKKSVIIPAVLLFVIAAAVIYSVHHNAQTKQISKAEHDTISIEETKKSAVITDAEAKKKNTEKKSETVDKPSSVSASDTASKSDADVKSDSPSDPGTAIKAEAASKSAGKTSQDPVSAPAVTKPAEAPAANSSPAPTQKPVASVWHEPVYNTVHHDAWEEPVYSMVTHWICNDCGADITDNPVILFSFELNNLSKKPIVFLLLF